MKFGKGFVRTVGFILGVALAFIWAVYGACQASRHAHAGGLTPPLLLSAGVSAAALAALLFAGITRLVWSLRKPDVVIVVTETPVPLAAKFHEQDRRLERRERLKEELFRLNGEIEAFNAELTADERKAWLHRPGPYGK